MQLLSSVSEIIRTVDQHRDNILPQETHSAI